VNRFERILLHLSALGAAATGGIFFWMKHVLRSDDPFSVVHHPWQPSVLALHVLIVPVLVFALGLIAREHMIGRLLEEQPHPSRRSGIAAMLLTVPMIGSGYLLQVLTGPGARKVVSIAHAGTGIVFALLYLLHLVLARSAHRTTRARASRRRGAPVRRSRLDWSRALGLESISRPEASPPQAGTGWRRP
jgi:hypothetical protein